MEIGGAYCKLASTDPLYGTVGSVIHNVIASWKRLRPVSLHVYQVISK